MRNRLQALGKHPWSLFAAVDLFLILLFLHLLADHWEPGGAAIISWDVFGYYLYLPGQFIYDDLSTLQWAQTLIAEHDLSATFYQAHQLPDSETMVMKYTMGMSIFYAPFFFIAHLLAEPLGYPADGISSIYQAAIGLGMLLYSLIGLLYTRRVLLYFFSDRVAAIVLVVLVLGTNLLQFTAYKGAMPHNVLFMLLAMTFWFTIKWHQSPRLRTALALGACIGLACLIRPSEAVILLLPLLWEVRNLQTLREKAKKIWRYRWHVLALAAIIFLCVAPQFIYWKSTTGSWLYYTYGDEGFVWSRPHLFEVLLSYKKGWFVYTPVMLLALAGFWLLWKQKREAFGALSLFFLINLYIVAAWAVWWYTASFGHRAFVQSYALMVVPLGFVVAAIVQSKSRFRKALGLNLLLLLVGFNLFQHWQYHHYLIHPTRMTAEAYWEVFMRVSKPPSVDGSALGVEEFYDPDLEYIADESSYEQRTLGLFDAEAGPLEAGQTDSISFSGQRSYALGGTIPYSKTFQLPVVDLKPIKGSWIRLSTLWRAGEGFDPSQAFLVLDFRSAEKTTKYKTIPLDSFYHATDAWNHIYLECIVPELRYDDDDLKAYVWNPTTETVLLDDLTLSVMDPRPLAHEWRTVASQPMEDEFAETIRVDGPVSEGQFAARIIDGKTTALAWRPTGSEDASGKQVLISAQVFSEGVIRPGKSYLNIQFVAGDSVHSNQRVALSWRKESRTWIPLWLIVNWPTEVNANTRVECFVEHHGETALLVDDMKLYISSEGKPRF